ncbi:serine protease [Schizosaccharomyces japonicus yFS275]|uniref:Dipeptidyl-peptidase V n=1 Tax=Schizosaccharomyces japonicus (strain yFS275 / FY16936) TaxID=402676 RepID=B6JZU6_SCHJY|nr:serine protease [Schizosaccharomyces japonicus yFS275]EEB06096.1 serine protease [Schizosaccharomyces japonicus yFS275]
MLCFIYLTYLFTTIRAMTADLCFQPQDMLETPRRSAISVNSYGTLALFTESVYNFTEHKFNNGLFLINTSEPEAVSPLVLGKSAKSPQWLDESSFIYIKDDDSDVSSLVLYDVESLLENTIYTHYAPIYDLKITTQDSTVRVVFSGLSEKPKKNPPKVHEYESIFARHWDHWITSEKNTIFSLDFNRTSSRSWLLPLSDDAKNLLLGTSLESPMEPFNEATDYSSSFENLVFVAKDPDLNPALNSRTIVYLFNYAASTLTALSETQGACSSPVISHDNTIIAWLEMKTAKYESDRNRIAIYDLTTGKRKIIADDWDRSPSNIFIGRNGDDIILYAIADDEGRQRLFSVNPSTEAVTQLTKEHSVIAASYANERLWLSRASFKKPTYFTVADLQGNESILYDNRVGLDNLGVEELWISRGSYRVHSWVVKPSNFDAHRKYPLAVFIHGGPQGSWLDGWSYRWNAAVFAEAGFVVLAINPTGSTGYGQAFTDAIQGNWGGAPYKDIEATVVYAAKSLGYIDEDKIVALGASYGGYMINWIQGQPLAKKLKAVVCHDGVFSTLNTFYTTDEIYFSTHDFLGTPWEAREVYERWNPANLVDKWSVPELIIHSSKDYRLPESEGLAAFNALQYKQIPSKLVIFEDENHWVLSPENGLKWHQNVLSWIKRYTKHPYTFMKQKE